MAKKMTVADLAPAHINALKSSLHAFEVQITLLKNMIAGSEAGEEEEEDAPAPAKKPAKKPAKPAKKAKEEEEEEFDLDEPEEEEEAEEEEEDLDEEEEEEAEEEEDEELTLDGVTKAFQKFAAKKPANREKAKKILQKFKVTSIRNLKPKDFQKAIDMISA